MFKIKAFLKQLQYSKSRLGRAVYTCSVQSWLFLKFLLSPRYRSEKLTRFKYREDMIQTSSATRMNRYPWLFKIASKLLKDIPDPQILSFGCSTGEEVFSIKTHIPNARIIGVDINQRVLRIARRKNTSNDLKFYHYIDQKWKTEGPYDCIFALAVFQKTEHRKQSQNQALESFSFKKFQQEIEGLDAFIKPGGILVIDNADFSFRDLAISQHYSIADEDQAITRNRPLISQENKKEASAPGHRIFIKNHPVSS